MKGSIHDKALPQEFQDDVVKVARLRQASMRQVDLDFGISAATLYKWLRKAEIEEGHINAMSTTQLAENRELRRRNRVQEQEVEILRRATPLLRQRPLPKMIYPRFRELADDGIAIRLTLPGSWILPAGLLQMGKAPNLASRL